MESNCCKKILLKLPIFNGKERFGRIWVCPDCLDIKGFEGKFLFSGWQVRMGGQGFGGYYQGRGLTKKQKKENKIAPNHGLRRKEMLAQNAYQPEV